MLLSTTWVRTVLTLSSYESITWDSLWNTGLCQYYQAAGQSVVANCAFKEGTNTVRSQKTQSCDPVHANQLKTLIVLSKLKKTFVIQESQVMSILYHVHPFQGSSHSHDWTKSMPCTNFSRFLHEIWRHLCFVKADTISVSDWVGKCIARFSVQFARANCFPRFPCHICQFGVCGTLHGSIFVSFMF